MFGKKKPPSDDEQFAQDRKEGMDPTTSQDFVMLGTKRLQVRLLHYSREERVVDALSEIMDMVNKVEPTTKVPDLVKLAKREFFRLLPEVTAVIVEPHGITLDWIQCEESGVTSVQMLDLFMAQLAKNGLADRLGKLSAIADQIASLIKILRST